MQLNDIEIIKLAEKGMIEPFFPERVQSFGYDMTLSNKFKVFTPAVIGGISFSKVDVLNPSSLTFMEWCSDYCEIPPCSFALGMSIEYFRIPEDILCICLGRSSYARCGIVPNVTPLEPGWEGYVTIEISNPNSVPAIIYANKGISQVIFLRGKRPKNTYQGRYNKQQDIVTSKGV